MGIVYEGFDPVIDRIVAIKTIKKDELDPEEAEEHSRRFLIEAKAAGRLNHKNIVGIYDYGEEKGLSFIVMEFVQGKELKSFFAARHPFSMSQIARLMGELLDALGYSHSRGVVHRDVKPDNIFITNDGSVKLGDFGIARIDSTSKTHAGTVLGTPSYMAPEQIRGETADARSDLYAAGVILYQFLVGERPFSGGMVAVMQKVLMETAKAPSAHNPSIPETIDNVVLKALAKAPDARFASAAEFNRELTAAVGLSTDEDESESTMIMSPAALKALQEAGPTERTGTGTGGTHTGTGTGGSGRSMVGATGGRAGAIEEAKRRAEEAKRRYEEDLKRAEAELQQAEEEQRTAEAEAQAQAARSLEESQALLDESAAWRQGGEALFGGQALLVDGPDSVKSGRALSARLRSSARGIAEFVEASYALSPAGQAELAARREALDAAATSQDSLAARIERESNEALSSIELKLEVLEHRLAGQDGAWGAESRSLEALDPEAGDAPIATIQGRLDKLAASVEQVGKGFASIKSRPLKLPERQAQRVAVIEAQLEAQGSQVARLRSELEGARARVKAAAEARRVAEEAARKAAEQAAREKAEQEARRKAEEEARLKAEAEKKRRDEEDARRRADEVERQRKEAEAKAQAAEKKRLAEEKARQEAVARRQAEEAIARKKADEETARKKTEDEARLKADAAAKLKSEEDAARKKAEADAKRTAEEQARLKADEETRKKAAAREAAAKDAAAKDAAAKEKAAREKADFEARRKADEEAARQAEAARASDDAEATMIAPIRGAHVDDAETTMLRPIEPPKSTSAPAPTPTPTSTPTTPTPPQASVPTPSTATSHAPTPAPGRNKLLLPIAGVAVVVVAAGAWFATRSSGPQAGDAPVAASAPVVTAAASESAPPAVAPPPVASAPTAPPVVVAQVDTASAAAVADQQSVDAAAQHKAEEDAQKKADAEAAKKAKAEEAARRKAEAASAADAGKGGVDAETEARALQRLNQGTHVAEADAANAKPPKSDPKADAAALFRKGYEAYLAGNVPEGVRAMERADAQGAPGARARLCAIYRKPTAAEGKDFLKEANKCKGID